MSAEQNIEAVKAMYDAFGRWDVEAILERVTDDVDWSTDAAIESAPWYGAKHGKAELPSFFEGIAKTGPASVRASKRSVFARAWRIPVSAGLTTTTRATWRSRIRASAHAPPLTSSATRSRG